MRELFLGGTVENLVFKVPKIYQPTNVYTLVDGQLIFILINPLC